MTGVAVTWESLDQNVATVSASGTVTGSSVGSARIVARRRGTTRTIADTVVVQVINPCLRLRALTLGTTYTGRHDANTCKNFLGFTQLDQFSVTTTEQAYYSARLTPTFPAQLVPLAVGSGFIGLPVSSSPSTALVVKRPGTFGLLVSTFAPASGSYQLTTELNPDPRQLCVPTVVTRQVSFETALTPV